MVTFTCQADDRHASEVAEESEGGREKTSVVKLIVFVMLLGHTKNIWFLVPTSGQN